MNKRPVSRIQFIGRILLILGIFALVIGVIWLAAAPSGASVWMIALSILANICGITLMTLKKY